MVRKARTVRCMQGQCCCAQQSPESLVVTKRLDCHTEPAQCTLFRSKQRPACHDRALQSVASHENSRSKSVSAVPQSSAPHRLCFG